MSETGGSGSRRNQERQRDDYEQRRNYDNYNSDPLYLSSSDFPGNSLVSWKTKKQKTVAKSSAEAEYRAMSATTFELEWIAHLLLDLQLPLHLPISMHCDNKAAQHIAENPVFHERTKHLNIDCHYTRDKVLEGFLQTTHVSSQEQLADLMTKPLGELQHNYLCSRLGLLDSPLILP